MSSADEADARVTENIGRAAQFLDEVFDDPGLLDDIPAGAYVLLADSAADETALTDTATRMTAAGKPAKVFRLGNVRIRRRTGSST